MMKGSKVVKRTVETEMTKREFLNPGVPDTALNSAIQAVVKACWQRSPTWVDIVAWFDSMLVKMAPAGDHQKTDV
jgi:hypothetical protein